MQFLNWLDWAREQDPRWSAQKVMLQWRLTDSLLHSYMDEKINSREELLERMKTLLDRVEEI